MQHAGQFSARRLYITCLRRIQRGRRAAVQRHGVHGADALQIVDDLSERSRTLADHQAAVAHDRGERALRLVVSGHLRVGIRIFSELVHAAFQQPGAAAYGGHDFIPICLRPGFLRGQNGFHHSGIAHVRLRIPLAGVRPGVGVVHDHLFACGRYVQTGHALLYVRHDAALDAHDDRAALQREAIAHLGREQIDRARVGVIGVDRPEREFVLAAEYGGNRDVHAVDQILAVFGDPQKHILSGAAADHFAAAHEHAHDLSAVIRVRQRLPTVIIRIEQRAVDGRRQRAGHRVRFRDVVRGRHVLVDAVLPCRDHGAYRAGSRDGHGVARVPADRDGVGIRGV